MKKRILSMLLAIVMVVGLLPGMSLTASAADDTTWDGTTVATAYAGGTGTETDPYIIKTAGQLIYFRDQVNGGQSYDGQYFRLDADLDMASKSFGNSIGYINSSYKSYYFNGHFDGNNHTISNLTINSTSGYTALFGNVGFGTNESVISNLTLSGVNINRTATNYGAAALIGQAKSVKIANCTIESGTVNCKGFYTAGFVANIASGGSGLSMINCINKATITSTNTSAFVYTAGICAYVDSSSNITGCVNYGNVTNQKGCAGGISAYSIGAVIEKCANYGVITNTGTIAAGILSNCSNYSITNCFNQGDVSASQKAGGITEYLNTSKTDKIENCYNVGAVSITSTPSYHNYCDPITTTSSRSENIDHVINTYTLTDSGSGATTKTAYEFKSGAVALLLQGTQSETIWGQGTDYPEFYDGTNPIPEPPAAVTGITLSADNLTLNASDSTSLTATVTPDNAGNKNVSWSSSAPSVATVEDGLVKAIAEGNAVITATAEDGGFNAICTVTVQTHAHTWNAYEAKCGTCDSTHYTHTNYEWTNGVCSVCGVIGGYCGYVNQESSVEWMLTSVDSGTTYTLTISGTGNMGEYIDYNDGVDAPWFAYESQITTVVINDGVKAIGWGAFKHLVNLTSVSIPNSVTEIKRAAFLGATSLTSISIPDSVTTIGQSVFKKSGLTSISIPSGVTKIQGATFSECKKLTSVTLPNSITEIEGSAFQQCTALTSINIPDSVTSIGESAFNQSGLTSVTIPGSVTSLGMHAFSGCPKLKTVTINGTNLTIAERAFQGDEALETLTINNTGNVSIRDYAFMINVTDDDGGDVIIGDVTIGGWESEDGGSIDTDSGSSGSNGTTGDNTPGDDTTGDGISGGDTTGSVTITRREDKLYSITLPADVTYATNYATSFGNRVRSISIEETAEVVIDSSITLTPVFTPDTAYDKTITWTSSNNNVATVDSSGKVTGVSEGEVTITATAKYQLNSVYKSDSCTVTVRTHDHNWSYSLKDGTTDTLEAICQNATDCPNTNGGSVTISANHGTYNGTTEFKATYSYSDDWMPAKDELTISYEHKATESGTYAATTELKNAGYYKASIQKTNSDGTVAVASVEYTIAKADAAAPTGLTAVYGQTLANVSLPDGWTWETPADSVGDVGTHTHKANYAGDNNYNAASDVDVTVTVSQSGSTMTVSADKSAYTYGETVTITVSGITPTGEAAANVFSLTTPTTNQVAIWNGETQLTDPQTVTGSNLTFTVTGLNAGSYTLTAKFTGNANMAETTANVTFTVERKNQDSLTITGTPMDSIAYGDTFTLGTTGGTGDGTVTWSATGTASVDASGKVTITGVGDFTITATKAGGDNYNNATDTYSGTSIKANPDIGTVSYTGTTLYDSTAISTVMLTRSDTTIPGTLSLTNSELKADQTTYNWKFVPTDSANYNTLTGTVTLTVTTDVLESIAASGTLSKTAYEYGDTFSIAGLTVTATYTSKATKNVTSSVTFEPLAVGQTEVVLTYQGKTCTVSGITVSKKQLDVSGMSWSVPTGDAAIYSGSTKTAVLNGTLPTGVSVTKTGDSATNVGTYTATAAFSLVNGYSADNYEIVGTNPLTAGWSITQKNLGENFTVDGVNASYTYTGQKIEPSVTVKDGNTTLDPETDYDVTYGSNTNVAEGGSVTVTLQGNYSGAKTVNFAIVKSDTDFTISTYLGETPTTEFTYSDTITVKVSGIVPATYSLKPHDPGKVALYVKVDENNYQQISDAVPADAIGVYTMTYDTTGKALAIGSNTLYVKYVSDGNMDDHMESVTVTLKQVPLTVTVNTAGVTKVYDGTTTVVGTQQPTLTLNGVLPADKDAVIASAVYAYDTKSVGTDKIINASGITLKSDSINSYYSVPVAATGSGAAITEMEIGIEWSNTSLTYNGKAQKPTATAARLVSGDTCVITVSGEQTNAGEYTATATELNNSNYKLPDDASTEFSIAPKTVNDPAIELSSSSFVYDGKAKEPTVVVKDPDTGDVIATNEYTFAFSNNINVSTAEAPATVTITDKADGNYTVSGTATFTISQSTASMTAETNSTSYIYGDKITVTVNVAASGNAVSYGLRTTPAANQVVIYNKNTQITEPMDVENDVAEFMIDIVEAGLIPGQYTLKAVYTTSSNIASAEALTQQFTVSYLNTEAEASLEGTPGQMGWYTSNVTVKAPAGYSITTALNGADTDWATPVTVASDGTTAVSYYLRNSSGQITGEKSIEVKRDTVNPVISSVTVSNVTDNSAVVTVTASDAASGIFSYVLASSDNAAVSISKKGNGIFLITDMLANKEYDFTVTVTDTAGLASSASASVNTSMIDLSNADVTITGDYVYNGQPQFPVLSVVIGSKTLIPGDDYSISYSNTNGGDGNHTDAGTVTVTITGKGAYCGETTAQFVIRKAGTVAAPVIMPGSTQFSDSLEITITCATDGAAIYYTTDGSKPTIGSTMYTAPFVITDNTTVRAFAVKANMDDSEEAAVSYEIKVDSGFDYDMWYWALMMLYNQEFNITAIATEGGTITPTGTTKVKYSKDQLYTITPAEGYMIADVIVDGVSIGAVEVYNFDNVRKAHTITAIFTEIPWQNPFTDVWETDVYFDDVKYVYQNGLMIGTGDDTFSPDTTLTRAMLVTILWRQAGQPIAESPVDFFDVPANQWYSEAIAWASAHGIVLGYGDGTFGTNDPITREQLATILYRYEQHLGGGFRGLWMYRMDYDDLADVSDWAYEAVAWMNMKEIYVLRDEDLLAPREKATRAETAMFLRRFCEYRKDQEEQ